MAKINITLDLDSLDFVEDGEDGEGLSIDEILKDKIIEGVSSNLSLNILKANQIDEKSIVADAKERIAQSINNTIDVKLNNLIDGFLNKKIDVHDKWGDITEENVAITDILKRRLDKYLTEKVDGYGKLTHDSYHSSSRLDYMINKHISYPLTQKVEEAAADINEKLETYMQKQFQEKVGKKVAELLNIDKL